MSEQTALLDESVRRLSRDLATPDVIAAAEDGTWPDRLWRALIDNGLTHTLVPESQGGVGAGWQDAYVVLRAAGHYALPVPLAETMIAGRLLGDIGLAAPRDVATIAATPTATGLTADGDGFRLTATFSRVPWARSAQDLVCLGRHDGRVHVVRAALADADIAPGLNIAREPRDTVRLTDCPVEAVPLGDGSPDLLLRLGALARAAQIAGGLEYILGQSVSYANDRVQFGRPIAKFQAIQQNLAVLASETAAAGIAAETAARTADQGDADFEIAIAKTRAGEAVESAVAIAHQVHGAIGFTHEHALHFVTRRLWSWRAEFGDDGFWADRLGRQALDQGAEALWPYVTSR